MIAGPGSGKTAVITSRTAHLISTHHVDPSNILTITFTRSAALEMAARAGRLMGDRASFVTYGTFHSVFLNILRHTYRFTSDNIITYSTQIGLLREISEALKIELSDRNRTLSGLLCEISRVKCSPSINTDLKGGGFESAFIDSASFSELFKRYKKRMSDLRLIDFDDMMLLSLELFKNRPETLERWQERFIFIQVDEFQDLDKVQYELLKLLSGKYKNLFAVGDDDQSIYGFRGADPSIMMNFSEDYPGAEMLYLSENFRSDPEIVSAAGKVIAQNSLRLKKNVVPGLEREEGDGEKAVDIREFKDRDLETEALKEIYDKACKDPKEASGNMAILLRTNELLSYFAEKLSMLGIPFKCRDRINNIYDNFIAEDILDYLSVAGGDMRRSLFYKIMNRPYRGISRNAVSGEMVSESEILKFHRGDLKTTAEIRRLFMNLKMLSKMKPYAAVHYILYGMGYERYLKSLSSKKKQEDGEFIRTALEIRECAKPFRSAVSWMEAIEDYRGELERINRREDKKEENTGLCLMTMHASKGLEFDEVFLFDVNERIIPYHKACLPEEREEERRLFYTAMTRAKKRLHLWYIRDNTGKKMERSAFLDVLCKDQDEDPEN